MARFRTNHGAGRSYKSGSGFARSILLIFVAAGILIIFGLLLKKDYFKTKTETQEQIDYTIPGSGTNPGLRYFLPKRGTGELIHHKYYSLSYLEEHEIPEWVAYELTKESLFIKNVPRTNWYEKDASIPTGSADYYDYKGSGYTRGHLAPAGDMAFNKEAMEESFFMSNITPQKRSFNNGVWKELEENVRDWAIKNDRLFIIAGPILDKRKYQKIGKNEVSVPEQFFKVILDADDPEMKAIAFLIPNRISENPLADYAASVDEIEEITGLDFFAEMLSNAEQKRLESDFDVTKWPLSEKRFELRVKEWNRQ